MTKCQVCGTFSEASQNSLREWLCRGCLLAWERLPLDIAAAHLPISPAGETQSPVETETQVPVLPCAQSLGSIQAQSAV